MKIDSVQIRGLLSFGAASEAISLGNLNVFIGPNGAGKSNLFDIFDLLRSIPRDLSSCIRRGGGIHEWIWKGAPDKQGSIELHLTLPNTKVPLHYSLALAQSGGRVEILEESVATLQGFSKPCLYYGLDNGHPVIRVAGHERRLHRDQLDPGKSILEQRRDPDSYPELTSLAECFEHIRLYREWSVGRQNLLRLPQSTDGPVEFLEPDGSNLGLTLNYLKKFPKSKRELLEGLSTLSSDFQDFQIEVLSSTVQILIQEENWSTPAARLSDGTLRYLALLAILCHPNPPPVICIEEPEIGIHPDLLPSIARLLERASERCQLLVTTHSDILVDALSHIPDSIAIVEKHHGSTQIRPLSKQELRAGGEGLGNLWTSGQLGGTRW